MSHSPPTGEATPLHGNHAESHQIHRPATLFGEDSGRFSPLSEKEVPMEDDTINGASDKLNNSRECTNEDSPEPGKTQNLAHSHFMNDGDAAWRENNDDTQVRGNGVDVPSKKYYQNINKCYDSKKKFTFENDAGNGDHHSLDDESGGQENMLRPNAEHPYNAVNSLSDSTLRDTEIEREFSEENDNLDVFELARASQDLWNRLNTSINVDDSSVNRPQLNQVQSITFPVGDLNDEDHPQRNNSSTIDTLEVSIEGSTGSVENIPPSPSKLLSNQFARGAQSSKAKISISMKNIQSTPLLNCQLKSLNKKNDEKPGQFISSLNNRNNNAFVENAQHNNHLTPYSATDKAARIFSPFSAQARRLAYHHDEIAKSPSKMAKTRNSKSSNQMNNSSCLNFGLQHCRKVSVLLKVSPHPRLWHDFENEGDSSNGFNTPQLRRRKSTFTSSVGSTGDEAIRKRHTIVHQRKEHEINAEIFDDEDRIDDDGYGPILFPLLSENSEGHKTNAMSELFFGRSNDFIVPKSLQHGEVVLVNPNAFVADEEDGSVANRLETVSVRSIESKEKQEKRILGRVTVETARLVAEVSQISSEDWARKYKFDDVMWPNHTTSTTDLQNHKTDSIDTLSALARAAVRDSISHSAEHFFENQQDDSQSVINSVHGHCSAVICAVGGANSGKSETIFGSDISRLLSVTMNKNITEAGPRKSDFGLLGNIASEILSSNPAGFLLSILEIVEDDMIRDVLQATNDDIEQSASTDSLRVRHLDKRGAIVLNLTQLSMQSMDEMKCALLAAFKSKSLRSAWQKEGGHGHFIVTVSPIPQLQTDTASRGESPRHRSNVIQLVDLASADRPVNNFDSLDWKKCHERRVSSVRKSISALRGVLRELLIKATHSSNQQQTISYRESTLTQLLQRSLQEDARVVVLGMVCPSSKSYNQTLATMDFMSRLLRKPGEMAHGPFDNSFRSQEMTSHRESFVSQSSLTSLLKSHSIDSLEKEETNSVDCSKNGMSVIDAVPRHKYPSFVPSDSVILNNSAPDGVFLKSYVSDPRQRLAKLLNTAPPLYIKPDTQTEAIDCATSPNNCSSSNSDEKSFGISRQRYDSVFEQLDDLMDDDQEDDDQEDDDQHHYDGNDFLRTLATESAFGTNGKLLLDDGFDSDPEHY
ncbi:hypothetical protein ACHAXS_005439, partial [Conticribra weissflogii]